MLGIYTSSPTAYLPTSSNRLTITSVHRSQFNPTHHGCPGRPISIYRPISARDPHL